jgi:hypothetical protein
VSKPKKWPRKSVEVGPAGESIEVTDSGMVERKWLCVDSKATFNMLLKRLDEFNAAHDGLSSLRAIEGHLTAIMPELEKLGPELVDDARTVILHCTEAADAEQRGDRPVAMAHTLDAGIGYGELIMRLNWEPEVCQARANNESKVATSEGWKAVEAAWRKNPDLKVKEAGVIFVAASKDLPPEKRETLPEGFESDFYRRRKTWKASEEG